MRPSQARQYLIGLSLDSLKTSSLSQLTVLLETLRGQLAVVSLVTRDFQGTWHGSIVSRQIHQHILYYGLPNVHVWWNTGILHLPKGLSGAQSLVLWVSLSSKKVTWCRLLDKVLAMKTILVVLKFHRTKGLTF